jgi:hypothetical protein
MNTAPPAPVHRYSRDHYPLRTVIRGSRRLVRGRPHRREEQLAECRHWVPVAPFSAHLRHRRCVECGLVRLPVAVVASQRVDNDDAIAVPGVRS